MIMVPRRRQRTVLRSWRLRRVRQAPHYRSEAAAVLARRSRRHRRARVTAKVGGLPVRPGTAVTTLAALALVAAVGAVLATGAHRIRGASVVGNQRVSAGAIYAASGLNGQSVLGLDTAAAAERVMALDGIRHAQIAVGLPRRATITVVETQPTLLWQSPTGVFAIDERGVAAPPPPDTAGLIQVHDLSGAIAAPGDHLDPSLVAAAAAYGSRFGKLRYEAGIGFGLTTVEGWDVRLGVDAAAAPRQADLLAAFRHHVAGRQDRVAALDLRSVDRPYYRLGETGE